MLRGIKPRIFGKILDCVGIHGIFVEIMGEDSVVKLKFEKIQLQKIQSKAPPFEGGVGVVIRKLD